MIELTDVTGLAGCTLAIVALAVRLPGVARLQRSYLLPLLGVIVILSLIPFGGLPLAAYVRGATGDLSITTLLLLVLAILRPLAGWPRTDVETRSALLLLLVLAAFGLYPMALGFRYFDPYRLGYGNPWLLGGLLLTALACLRRYPAIALAVALAVLAWSAGWYESTNLWDYLLDPLLAVYAIGALVKRGVSGLSRLRG